MITHQITKKIAARLMTASTLTAASPKQLDWAAKVMTTVLGQWDKQKDLGGGQGILTWKPTNPKLKALGVKGAVVLTYKGDVLTLDVAGQGSWSGKAWKDIHREIKSVGSPLTKALLKTNISLGK